MQLYEDLCYHCGLPVQGISGSANKIFNICKEIIADLPDLIIFVDEIDYAFRNSQLLGAIRDIVDGTTAVVILIGMQNAYKELLNANAHYFDRCSYFVEFKTLNYKDVKLLIESVSDITMDSDTIKEIHRRTSGTLRKIIKLIHTIEIIAKTLDVKVITFNDTLNLFNG